MTLADRVRASLAESEDQPVPHASDMGDAPDSNGVAAAVLIAITDRAEPGLILTQRPETMRRHAGQAAFPGGRVDASDADVIAAALREAEEEIGLPRDIPEIIGTVDLYRTITSYTITPVLAVIPPDLPLVANPDEVSHIFEVPLAFLIDPANHVAKAADWNGRERHFIEMHWQGHRIWGATAAMIVNLSRRLTWQA